MNFVEEGKRRAELVRKALEEGRVEHFRWNPDGSGCTFCYKGIDHHGMEAWFMSSLNRENSISVFSGKLVYVKKKGGEQ